MSTTHIDSRPYAWPWNGALRADKRSSARIDVVSSPVPSAPVALSSKVKKVA